MIFLSKILCFGMAFIAANSILQPYHLLMIQQPNYVNKFSSKQIPLFTYNIKKEPDYSLIKNIQFEKISTKDWNFSERKINDAQLRIEDPCLTMPCLAPNARCIIDSSSKRTCVCRDNYFAINGNAALFGCKSRRGLLTRLLPIFNALKCTTKTCGPNAFCMNNRCRCAPGYFQTGITFSAQECKDPCSDGSNPCRNRRNTACLAVSSTLMTCVCTGKFVPIKGSAFMFGCGDQDDCSTKSCGANSFCVIKASKPTCVCESGNFVASGNNIVDDGCNNPCMETNACGLNTICSLTDDKTKLCTCQPGFLLVDDNTEDMEGCNADLCSSANCGDNSFCDLESGAAECVCHPGYFKDDDTECKNPCDSSPCSMVMNSECLSLTATKFDCICPFGFRPTDGVNPDNGCEKYCNYRGFEIDNGVTTTAPDGASVQCSDGELVILNAADVPHYATMCNVNGFAAAEGGCYFASTHTVSSADDARQACIDLNGDLAGPPDINDGESYNAVLTALSAATNVEYWVGIQQSSGTEPFYQVYPDPTFMVFPLDSPLWGNDQPNGDTTGASQQNCARLKRVGGKYNVEDKGCTDGTHPYLCVIPNVSTK